MKANKPKSRGEVLASREPLSANQFSILATKAGYPINPSTVCRGIAKGQIRAHRFDPDGTWKIPPDELARYLRACGAEI